MFENTAIDVVTGLVFIYLLYSLLITILGEFVSTKLGIRARILRIALERMLNDGYYAKQESKKGKYWQGWLRKTFLYEAAEFKTSFAGKFYDSPSIKYLGRIEEAYKGLFSLTKPAYITRANFADTVIQLLVDKGLGSVEAEKISMALQFNTYHIQPETIKQLCNLWEKSGKDKDEFHKNLMLWFDETMDRASGWYKRKIQVILFLLGFFFAVAFNVDSIGITHILAKDKEARSHMVNMAISFSKDSTSILQSRHSNDTLSSSIIDSSFREIRTDIQQADQILGWGWHLGDLRKDKSYKVAFADLHKKGWEQHQLNALQALLLQQHKLSSALKDQNFLTHALQLQLSNLYLDTLVFHNNYALYQKKTDLDSMLTLKKQIQEIVSQLIRSKEMMQADSLVLAATSLHLPQLMGKLVTILPADMTSVDSISTDHSGNLTVSGPSRLSCTEKIHYILSNFPKSIVGWLLTALALSLGAPFWFDLLNKLVSVRFAGNNPVEKKSESNQNITESASETSLQFHAAGKQGHAVIADFTERALHTYLPLLKPIPGVISVLLVKNKLTNQKEIQVNVADEPVATAVRKKFPTLLSDDIEIVYKVKVNGYPSIHQLPQGSIRNKLSLNGTGSLGCVLQRKDTGSVHILSCWHVMKPDLSLPAGNDTILLDHEEKEVAERWSGGIAGPLDYGMAICFDKTQSNAKLQSILGMPTEQPIHYRSILQNDLDEQVAVKFFDIHTQSVKSGIVYAASSGVDIQYPDMTRTIADVLLLTDPLTGNTISREGNSGALVFDENNRALAMIIGGDSYYTYAIKLTNIFRIHQEMIIR